MVLIELSTYTYLLLEESKQTPPFKRVDADLCLLRRYVNTRRQVDVQHCVAC